MKGFVPSSNRVLERLKARRSHGRAEGNIYCDINDAPSYFSSNILGEREDSVKSIQKSWIHLLNEKEKLSIWQFEALEFLV